MWIFNSLGFLFKFGRFSALFKFGRKSNSAVTYTKDNDSGLSRSLFRSTLLLLFSVFVDRTHQAIVVYRRKYLIINGVVRRGLSPRTAPLLKWWGSYHAMQTHDPTSTYVLCYIYILNTLG